MLWKQQNFKTSRHHIKIPDRSTVAPNSAAKMMVIADTVEVATGDSVCFGEITHQSGSVYVLDFFFLPLERRIR